jgi:enamine deaminase RidA (YjgF/YER057c/UK114 family)
MKSKAALLFAVCSAAMAASAAQADVIRHPIPNSTFPIAQAVEVTGNARTVYVSGQVPPAINKDADPNSAQAYGDTKTQTVGVCSTASREFWKVSA